MAREHDRLINASVIAGAPVIAGRSDHCWALRSLPGVPITARCSDHCRVFRSLPSSSVVAVCLVRLGRCRASRASRSLPCVSCVSVFAVRLGHCRAVDLGFSCAFFSLSPALTCDTFAVNVLLVNRDKFALTCAFRFLRAVLLRSPVINSQ